MQLDLVYASWFSGQISELYYIILYLVLVLADLHLFLTILQQYSNSIISVLRCNAPNVLKISLFIFKTCKKLNKGFRYNRLWYIWHTPSEGGQASRRLIYHPETETYAIRFSIRQLIFWPNFVIIDQYLVLVLADLHLFLTILQQYSNSIISVLRWMLQMCLKYPYLFLKHVRN